MTIESTGDLDQLHALGQVAATIRDTVARSATPGCTTRQLDRLATRMARDHGAQSAPQEEYGFPGFLCLSVNDAVVHGVPDDRPLHSGDLLTVDVTITRDGYVVDTARTVVVGARPSANRLTEAARAALDHALHQLRADQPLSRVGGAVSRSVEGDGFHVLRELCGHGVGRRIHEYPPVPNYAESHDHVVPWEGLVLAVEPIISESPTTVWEDTDGWTLRTVNGCHSAHHEHTVVVTEGKPVVVTSSTHAP